MSPSNKQHGFSLLEVLVAFVVMGLVVGVLLQLFGSAMHHAALADEYTLAVQVAESHMAEVGTSIEVKEGDVDGDDAGSGYHWEVAMQALELSDALADLPLAVQLYQVQVTVSWQSEGRTRQFQLDSLRFGEKK